MLKHPIYLLLCAGAGVYLAVADAEGWSLWNTISMRMPSAFGGNGVGGGSTFHHK